MSLKLLFVDRDGCLIEEPPDEQIDSLDKFRLLPEVILSNSDVADAAVVVRNGNPTILVTLSQSAAGRFATTTEMNVGRRMAILIDGEVVSAPIIRGRIEGGKAMITGDFDRPRAERIARALRAAG